MHHFYHLFVFFSAAGKRSRTVLSFLNSYCIQCIDYIHNSKYMRSIILLSLLTFASLLSAQKLELGLWGGISFYSGDFSPQEFDFYLQEQQPAGGIFLRLNPGKVISLELGVNLGKIAGEDGVDNGQTSRNLNFRSNITEVGLKLDLNLVHWGNVRRTQVVPYLMGGAAVFRFNPEGRLDGNWIELQPLGTEGQGAPGYAKPYSLTDFAILGGGGLKFIIKQRFTIGLELGGRKTFTDYLDDVSNVNVNYLDVLETSGSLAAQLSNPNIKDPEVENLNYRRGGEFKDWYFMSGISFSFAFGEGSGVNGRGIGCPTF